jgi:hypothetical protein
MKYSTHNLQDCRFPLQFPLKLIVEYRPNGVLVDFVDSFTATEGSAVDEVVRRKGWSLRPGFKLEDVWVDGAF